MDPLPFSQAGLRECSEMKPPREPSSALWSVLHCLVGCDCTQEGPCHLRALWQGRGMALFTIAHFSLTLPEGDAQRAGGW